MAILCLNYSLSCMTVCMTSFTMRNTHLRSLLVPTLVNLVPSAGLMSFGPFWVGLNPNMTISTKAPRGRGDITIRHSYVTAIQSFKHKQSELMPAENRTFLRHVHMVLILDMVKSPSTMVSLGRPKRDKLCWSPFSIAIQHKRNVSSYLFQQRKDRFGIGTSYQILEKENIHNHFGTPKRDILVPFSPPLATLSRT